MVRLVSNLSSSATAIPSFESGVLSDAFSEAGSSALKMRILSYPMDTLQGGTDPHELGLAV